MNELIQREQLDHIPVNSNVWPIAANRRSVLTCPCVRSKFLGGGGGRGGGWEGG